MFKISPGQAPTPSASHDGPPPALCWNRQQEPGANAITSIVLAWQTFEKGDYLFLKTHTGSPAEVPWGWTAEEGCGMLPPAPEVTTREPTPPHCQKVRPDTKARQRVRSLELQLPALLRASHQPLLGHHRSPPEPDGTAQPYMQRKGELPPSRERRGAVSYINASIWHLPCSQLEKQSLQE